MDIASLEYVGVSIVAISSVAMGRRRLHDGALLRTSKRGLTSYTLVC